MFFLKSIRFNYCLLVAIHIYYFRSAMIRLHDDESKFQNAISKIETSINRPISMYGQIAMLYCEGKKSY